MIIGILSDTHGDTTLLAHAMEVFSHHEVHAVVHCGDVGSLECLRMLAGAEPKAYIVAGNTDRHLQELSDEARQLGAAFASEIIQVPLGDGRALAATHGHDPELLGELIADRQFPYICHGHSHRIRDDRVEDIRVINPGALHRAKVRTVAVLDTETDVLEHIIVP
jgi:putative phosphoesterase